jgi:hypothetical protein
MMGVQTWYILLRSKEFTMAKKIIFMGTLLFAAAFGLAVAGCGGSGGSAVPVEKLADTLGKLKANTADTPHTVKLDDTVNITVKMRDIDKAVKSEGKYVVLDFSACTAKDNTVNQEGGDNEYIKGIILPKTLTTIGIRAFAWWKHLTTISIPSGVTSIGSGAFSECGLTSVTIPSSVTEIEDGAFLGNSLTSVTLPANVTMMEDDRWSSFPGNLVRVYASGGKLAGTYTSGDGGETWTRQ